MKTIFLLSLGILFFTLPGCNNFKSTHPQAHIADEKGDTGITDKFILNFSGTIDRELRFFKKEYSVIYKSGDLSLYAEKYSAHRDGILYKTYTSNGNISSTVKSYYLKNDSLILVTESTKWLNEQGEVFKDVRTYLRNNIIFKIDSRTASSAEALRTLPYLLVPAVENKYPDENYTDDLKAVKDAVLGQDKFEMVFDHIATYPDAIYITLKSKLKNNYKANILVSQRDPFIDSLLNTPAVFKDEKLKLNWKIEDQETVYVPVAKTTTSAKGLNK